MNLVFSKPLSLAMIFLFFNNSVCNQEWSDWLSSSLQDTNTYVRPPLGRWSFRFLWCIGRGIFVVCAAAVRIHCCRRNHKEVRQLLISICGLLRRSESGALHWGSLQRTVLLEKPLLFTLKNLPGERTTMGREGRNRDIWKLNFIYTTSVDNHHWIGVQYFSIFRSFCKLKWIHFSDGDCLSI